MLIMDWGFFQKNNWYLLDHLEDFIFEVIGNIDEFGIHAIFLSKIINFHLFNFNLLYSIILKI